MGRASECVRVDLCELRILLGVLADILEANGGGGESSQFSLTISTPMEVLLTDYR